MIDIIIIVLFLYGIIRGYKKGLIKSLLNFINFFISSIISFMLTRRIFLLIASTINIDDIVKNNDFFSKNINLSENQMKIILFFIFFISVKFIIRIIFRLLNKISKLPLINISNSFLGGILGFLQVYTVLLIFIYIIMTFKVNEILYYEINKSMLSNFIYYKTSDIIEYCFEYFI